MIAVGVAAIAGRPLSVAADHDPDGAGAARNFAGLAGVAAIVAAHQRLSADHRAIGTGHLLFDLRLEFYLQRFHGWDQTSAFLAGSPGALSQLIILAAEKGADVPAIAVVQTMRVIILTAALPLVLASTGLMRPLHRR